MKTPRLLNCLAAAAMHSAGFLWLVMAGANAVPWAVCLMVGGSIVLNWGGFRQPIQWRRPSATEVTTALAVVVGIVALIAASVAIGRDGRDIVRVLLEDRFFVVCLWLVVVLLDVRRMMGPAAPSGSVE